MRRHSFLGFIFYRLKNVSLYRGIGTFNMLLLFFGHTDTYIHTHTHTYTNKAPRAGVQLVVHTSIS